MMDTMTEQRQLAALVTAEHDKGVSYREMAARAQRAGHTISHSQMREYALDGVRKMPTPDQRRALAAALDKGYEEVSAACYSQWEGYVPRELRNRKGSRISAAIPADLSSDEEEQLARMVEAWLASRTRGNDSGRP